MLGFEGEYLVTREAQLNRLDVLMGAQAGTYAAELEVVVRCCSIALHMPKYR